MTIPSQPQVMAPVVTTAEDTMRRKVRDELLDALIEITRALPAVFQHTEGNWRQKFGELADYCDIVCRKLDEAHGFEDLRDVLVIAKRFRGLAHATILAFRHCHG